MIHSGVIYEGVYVHIHIQTEWGITFNSVDPRHFQPRNAPNQGATSPLGAIFINPHEDNFRGISIVYQKVVFRD